LLGRSSLPFARLQTLKTLKMPRRPCACIASLCCSGVPACRLPAFKRVNPPQRPYTLCCWGVKPFAALQTRQPSAAALHILLVGVQECPGPASAPERFFKPFNFRSGPTDCLVEALRVPFAGLPSAQPSAAALHSTVLFKRLNPPQWRYTLSC
jgi:hypothetical protein